MQTAAVRDEGVSKLYAPIEVPAVASSEFISCLQKAALSLGYGDNVYAGAVHTKAALYAREFGRGPLSEDHKRYIDILSDLGILATEMETSALYIMGQYYNKSISPISTTGTVRSAHKVLVGSILAVIGDDEAYSSDLDAVHSAVENAVEIALEGVRIHATEFIF